MKIAFILNPAANGGKGKEYGDRIRTYAFPEGVEWELVWTTHPKEATILARNRSDQFDICCAVGGDGTVREVAEGLVENQKTALGIIPAGTGNDVVTGLGLQRDFGSAMERLFKQQVHPIDCGYADSHFFLNIATVGFDAHVTWETERFKTKIRSKMAYRFGLAVSFFRYRSMPSIRSDGDSSRLFLLAAGNGSLYGGGFPILPQARMDDGKLDFCWIENIPRWKALALFPSLIRGKHEKHRAYVTMQRLEFQEVDVCAPFFLNLDGELIQYPHGKRIRFEIRKDALQLVQ